MTTEEFDREVSHIDHNLQSLALKLTRDPHDAENLVQETIYRAFWNREHISTNANFKAWVTGIMHNAYTSGHIKRVQRVSASRPDPYVQRTVSRQPTIAVAEPGASLEQLQELLQQLPEAIRLPFVLYYRGYRCNQISEKLSLSEATVKTRIFMARRKLRDAVERAQGV